MGNRFEILMEEDTENKNDGLHRYILGNKCGKNCCKRTILVQLIVEDVVTCFFWDTVYIQSLLYYIRPMCFFSYTAYRLLY